MKKRLAVGLLTGALVFGATGTAIAATNAPTATPTTSSMSGHASHHTSSATPTPKSGSTSSGGMMGGSGSGGMIGGSNSGGMMSGMMSDCQQDMMGGMMGSGSGGMMGGQAGTSTGKPITLAQAQKDVQQYVAKTGKPNLAVDEVMQFQNNFYAIVKNTTTKQGAFEVLVNKTSGAVLPEFGPAMMWNTASSMMTGMMGYEQATAAMTVTPAQAQKLAQQWLDTHQAGSTAETPDQFPGYFTVHILKGGTVTGMLSVNGYSGQIWNHTWHGAFVQMTGAHS